jgi:hypothetical protein
VFTARYGLNPFITRIVSSFRGLLLNWCPVFCEDGTEANLFKQLVPNTVAVQSHQIIVYKNGGSDSCTEYVAA